MIRFLLTIVLFIAGIMCVCIAAYAKYISADTGVILTYLGIGVGCLLLAAAAASAED